MNSVDDWAEFFGWCTVLNFGIYLLTVVLVAVFRDLAVSINARVFSLDEEVIRSGIFRYVANYKLAITIFCFVPWLALKLMS